MLDFNKKRKHILFIDTHNLAYRTFFISEKKKKTLITDDDEIQEIDEEIVNIPKSQRDLSNPQYNKLWEGRTNRIWECQVAYWEQLFHSAMFQYVVNFKPDELVMGVDDRECWRKAIFPTYKEGRRKETDINWDKFFEEYGRILMTYRDLLPRIKLFKTSKTEADDIVGILCKHFSESTADITAVSNDKDYHQLHKYRGFKQFNPIKREYVQIRDPKMALTEKILLGDKSDKIPNVRRGTGPSRVSDILQEDRLSEFLDEDPQNRENYDRNRKLIDMEFIPQTIEDRIIYRYGQFTGTEKNDSFGFYNYIVGEKRYKMLQSSVRDFLTIVNKMS